MVKKNDILLVVTNKKINKHRNIKAASSGTFIFPCIILEN